jgi:hypothetical protein
LFLGYAPEVITNPSAGKPIPSQELKLTYYVKRTQVADYCHFNHKMTGFQRKLDFPRVMQSNNAPAEPIPMPKIGDGEGGVDKWNRINPFCISPNLWGRELQAYLRI